MDDLDQTPVPGAIVTLKKNDGTVAGTATTDQDGWYQIIYKHTGKEAPYTVTLSNVAGKPVDYMQMQTVALKANAYVNANFEVPVGP